MFTRRDTKGVVLTCLMFMSLFAVSVFLSACGGRDGRASGYNAVTPPDTSAMRRMEGIWVDAETGSVLLMVRADSIFYPDSVSVPASFCIVEDTLIVRAGGKDVRYPIVEQGDYNFRYESLTGDIIHMQRSDNGEDSLQFSRRKYAPILMESVVRRDTVVYSPGGKRYHLYIDVSPTRRKVYSTTYTDEGMAVRSAYFDNIIHITVYTGRQRVFSRDMSKRDFADIIPESFYEGAILSNMTFGRADREGCHFDATLCEPDGARCYVVDILVSYKGEWTKNLVEY